MAPLTAHPKQFLSSDVKSVIQDYYSDCSDTDSDSEEKLALERCPSTATGTGSVPAVPVNMEDDVAKVLSEFEEHCVYMGMFEFKCRSNVSHMMYDINNMHACQTNI